MHKFVQIHWEHSERNWSTSQQPVEHEFLRAAVGRWPAPSRDDRDNCVIPPAVQRNIQPGPVVSDAI